MGKIGLSSKAAPQSMVFSHFASIFFLKFLFYFVFPEELKGPLHNFLVIQASLPGLNSVL